MFAIHCNKPSVTFTVSNVFCLQNPNHPSHLTVGRIWYRRVHCHNQLHSQREKVACTNCTRQLSTLLNTPNDSSGRMKRLRGLYARTFFTFRTTLVFPVRNIFRFDFRSMQCQLLSQHWFSRVLRKVRWRFPNSNSWTVNVTNVLNFSYLIMTKRKRSVCYKKFYKLFQVC